MDNLNSSNLNTSFINYEHSSSSDLFSHLNLDNINTNFFSTKRLSESEEDSASTDRDSISSSRSNKVIRSSLNKKMSKFALFKDVNVRKDRYGNIIKKGGKHKVSFKDEIKGKLLVEMTLIDVKQSSVKGENVKKYTVDLMAKDKRELASCNIF